MPETLARIVVDVATGESVEVPLSPEEIADRATWVPPEPDPDPLDAVQAQLDQLAWDLLLLQLGG